MAQVALLIFIALGFILNVLAAPISSGNSLDLVKRDSSYWVANIQRQGTVAYGDSGYQIFRNIKDFGAVGDGVTDDTAAINAAISSGNRCGQGCDSSTVTPALVYFPPGTYSVSSPLIQYYYTQFVGDAVTPPTLKATAGFQGIAVIDSDPYGDGGVNWFTNQNNFYRQVRNFVIDITAMPASSGSCIHWQVAQATSLQNIVFNMVAGPESKQTGIFMDNGSANFLSDLTFNGGQYGAFFGNQQLTTVRLTFNNCQTAIYINWSWLWALKSITVNNCGAALDISSNPSAQNVGSAILQDSTITNTPVGVITAFNANSSPNTGGTFILDNVNFQNCANAVQDTSGNQILAGNTLISSWAQGREYVGSTGTRIQQTLSAPTKASGLLDQSGAIFERSKPQYENYPASSFISIKSSGAKGDGITDDTAAIQSAMNSIGADQILYFDHGAYVVSSTIHVPTNIKITGEIWPLIMASGAAFQNQASPVPVFQVGNPGDVGSVEMSDLVFETIGPQPGAIMLQWNLAGSSQGAAGMWDVHFRIGGSAGTNLQSDTCSKNPTVIADANPACMGAFLLLHIAPTASIYVENAWLWVADHELDRADHNQINIFNGRGALIESTLPTWLYGTSAEHSVLYQYAIHNAANVYMSAIQTETPYFQANPTALSPFTVNINPSFDDPTFSNCAAGDSTCYKSWGLTIADSNDILVYGAGLYSFFDNYDQSCLDTETCQENIVSVTGSAGVSLYGLSTKGVTNMVTLEGVAQVSQADNTNGFCETVALWTRDGAGVGGSASAGITTSGDTSTVTVQSHVAVQSDAEGGLRVGADGLLVDDYA